MEEIKATAAQEPAEDQEESLILKFRKPYMFEGKEYTEVDLSAMEDMTAEDLCAMGKIMTKLGIVNPVAEMTVDYAIYMAARASGKPVEFFKGLPPKEGIKLKNMVITIGTAIITSIKINAGRENTHLMCLLIKSFIPALPFPFILRKDSLLRILRNPSAAGLPFQRPLSSVLPVQNLLPWSQLNTQLPHPWHLLPQTRRSFLEGHTDWLYLL